MKKILQDLNYYIEINKSYQTICESIVSDYIIIDLLYSLKQYSKFTYRHSLHVAFLSYEIGCLLEFDRENILLLTKAALLHDVGKLFIPDTILNKKGTLDEKEFEIIKTHSSLGACYLLSLGFNEKIVDVAYKHHKKKDGSGYPEWNTKENSMFVKIVSIVDVFEAMTSNRPYKEPIAKEKTIDYLLSRDDKYDTDLIKEILRNKGFRSLS